MSNNILSVLIAFAAYSLLDLAKAVQKIAIGLSPVSRVRAVSLWIGATASTTASSFLLLYAVSLGSVLVVGAMAGTGLAALALFAAVVMKERIGGREILGVAAILTAPFLLAGFEARFVPPTG